MKDTKLIIVGFGIVGRGLAETLAKAGAKNLKVVAVCEQDGCIVDEKGIDLKRLAKQKRIKWGSKRTLDVIKNVDADCVVELTPGDINSGEPGLSHITAALKSGKHVVTSNKAPLALKFKELTKLAAGKKLMLRYEAAVGGAIPVFSTARNYLDGEKISNVYGILNGTTNFILSKMSEEALSMDAALRQAQELGLAESDPSYDVDGVDSGAKVAILANALLGRNVTFKDVKVTGIPGVTAEAVALAEKHGYAVKLIGDVGALTVSPRLIPLNHPLNVPNSLNAVTIEGDKIGALTLTGAGAGARETSRALLSDIMEVASA